MYFVICIGAIHKLRWQGKEREQVLPNVNIKKGKGVKILLSI